MTVGVGRLNPTQVGLAVGADSLTAARLGRHVDKGAVWSRPLPPFEDCIEFWTELGSSVEEMARALEVRPGRLFVALLPPLVQIRRINLPWLPDRDLRRVLARDAGKYFVGAAFPQAIGIARLESGRRSPQPLLVAAAPNWLVSGIALALESAGWTIEAIGPAHSAWAAATAPGLAAEPLQLKVSGQHAVEVLYREGGRLVNVRRLPRPSATAESGIELEYAEATAALHAGQVRALELVPEMIGGAQTMWRTRLGRRLWLATAAALLIAFGLLRLDLNRETARVDTVRLSLGDTVSRAMTARQAVEELHARLAALRDAEASAPRWTAVLGTVAERLPHDAHLSGFRGGQDSLALEGTARHAVEVFEALKQAPGFTGVRAMAPIRQETGDSQQTIERFSLAAWLEPADSVRNAP